MAAAEVWACGGRWVPHGTARSRGWQAGAAFAAEGQQSTGSVPGTRSLWSFLQGSTWKPRSLHPASAMVGKKCKHLPGFCSHDGNWQIIRSRWEGWGRAEQKSDASLWSLSQAVLGAGSAGASLTHTHGVGEPWSEPWIPPLPPARSADVVGISSHVCIENLKLWGFISSGVGDRKGKSNENLLKTENNKFLIFSPSSPTPWSLWIHGPDKQDTLCTWPRNLGLYPGDFTGVKLTTGELFYCSPTTVQTYGGLQVKNN